MRYDREMRRAHQGEEEGPGRVEYGAPYDSTFHGYAMGYSGGALRSRGSFQAGQLRSGLNPRDEFEFRWGDGYVGGRGYGGTNYDLTHGYRVGGIPRYGYQRPARGVTPAPRPESSPATRGGYSWSEYGRELAELYGPARYGYGPYYDRLQRRRRSDDEIRADVEEALFYDTWVDADRIAVEVEEGIVTLTGTLPNFDEVRFATDDAWDVDGVRGVRSDFEVGGRRIPAGAKAEAETGAPREEAEAASVREGRGTRRAATAKGGAGTSSARGRSAASARGKGTSSSATRKGTKARQKGGGEGEEKTEGEGGR
jgi:hypothetical protein